MNRQQHCKNKKVDDRHTNEKSGSCQSWYPCSSVTSPHLSGLHTTNVDNIKKGEENMSDITSLVLHMCHAAQG